MSSSPKMPFFAWSCWSLLFAVRRGGGLSSSRRRSPSAADAAPRWLEDGTRRRPRRRRLGRCAPNGSRAPGSSSSIRSRSRGLSLVDTKDEALRQKLIAAGYTAPYAPRVYTLVRLVLVIGLPVLVFCSLSG